MNKKTIIYTILAVAISSVVFFTGYTKYSNPVQLYRVYLSGKTIGYIKSEEELNNYIDKKEKEIKEKYNVEKVYAPKDLNIIKEETYNKKASSVSNIYSQIKNVSPFTIMGYTVTIKGVEESDEDETYMTDTVVVNVLNKKIFTDALKKTINVFVSEDKYKDYVN